MRYSRTSESITKYKRSYNEVQAKLQRSKDDDRSFVGELTQIRSYV